jgi:hypothetical protein
LRESVRRRAFRGKSGDKKSSERRARVEKRVDESWDEHDVVLQLRDVSRTRHVGIVQSLHADGVTARL